MNKLLLPLALLVAVCSYAVTAAHDPPWNDLRGTFESFAPFPRTLNDSLINSENWVQVGNDCTNGGHFNGFQYIRPEDVAVGLLYDVNGIIAGIQMLIEKSQVRNTLNTHNYNAIPMYQNATYYDQDYFVLTAYFVHPTTICTTGRTLNSLNQDGTGTGLWMQNGTGPANLLEVPLNRPESEDENENDKWTKNNCLHAMGFHNFYSIQQYEDTQCREIVPVFALYNKRTKQLHGFGFVTAGKLASRRFEKPPSPAIRLILGAGRTPQCAIDIQQTEGISSLHVYFTRKPWLIGCPVVESTVSYVKVATDWLRSKVLRITSTT